MPHPIVPSLVSSRRALVLAALLGTTAFSGLSAWVQTALAETARDVPFLVAQALDAGAALATPEDEAGVEAAVEDVVVTARRREERAQEVPAALTVVTSTRLEETGTSNIRQLQQQLPNVQFFVPNARNASISIRGLGSSIANDGLESAVGVFIDGVYYARPGAATFDLFDIERVELLRGPQGTLYGKNTTAGALSIETKKPSFTPEASTELSIGNYNYKQFQSTVSGPVSETVALRLTTSYSDRDGFIANVNPDSKAARDLNDYNNLSVRGQALWVPSDEFTLRVIADYGRQDQDCCVQLIGQAIETQPDGSPYANNYPARARRVGYTPLPFDPSARQTDINDPQYIKMKQWGLSAEANWQVFGDHTLTSITAYREWDFDPHNDSDFTAMSVLPQVGVLSHQSQFTQEVRLASPGGEAVDYVAGLYYFKQKIDSTQDLELGEDAGSILINLTGVQAIDGLIYPVINNVLNGLHSYQHATPETESYAAFGQTTWNLTERLALTAGLRYTVEQKQGDFTAWYEGGGTVTGGLAGALLPDALADAVNGLLNTLGAGALSAPVDDQIKQQVATPEAFSASRDESNLSGLVNLGYKIRDNVLAYALVSRGYKSGGINFASVSPGVSRDIDPEVATGYEMGLKSSWFDNRLQLNTALYWTNVEGYQSTLIDGQTFTTYLSNVGELRVRGVEVEGIVFPLPGLAVTGSVSYNDAEILSYPNAPCPPEKIVKKGDECHVDLSGKRAPAAPLWSAYIGAEYSRRLGEIKGQDVVGFIGGEYIYRSSYNTNPASSLTIVPAYDLTNIRLGLRAPDRKWSVSLWAKNLFDEHYIVGAGGVPQNLGAIIVVPGDPRTYGATVRYSW